MLALLASALIQGPRPGHVEGTIVSIRAGLLIVKPSLRPKITRVAVIATTQVVGFEPSSIASLRKGMRIRANGMVEGRKVSAKWIQFSEKPFGELGEKSVGVFQVPNRPWGHVGGTVESAIPLVVKDDAGTKFPVETTMDTSAFRIFRADKSNLLIGSRIYVDGSVAPDGVIQADRISPNTDYAASGSMFGKIIRVAGDNLILNPRFTPDQLIVHLGPTVLLQREIPIDPESIQVGRSVSFWGRYQDPGANGSKSNALLAIALLLGPGRYPQSEGLSGGSVVTGVIEQLEPSVILRAKGGQRIPIIVPAQLITARLVRALRSDLKPGLEGMFVLNPHENGTFETKQVILGASPWVGYGN
jgi:hypothetical protein